MSGAPQPTGGLVVRRMPNLRFRRELALDDYGIVQRSDFVIVNDTVVKDRCGKTPRLATRREWQNCMEVL